MSDARWSYLDAANQKQGPFSREALLQLRETGVVNEKTLVWRTGMPDWVKFSEAPDLAASSSAAAPSANILTQRLGNNQASSDRNPKKPRGVPGMVKFGALVALVAGVVIANRMFLILPGSGGVVDSDLPDRWFTENNREGVIMQCTFDKKAGRGPNGGPRFRVSAIVSAGVARNRVLPVDRAGSSRVIIRDSEGKEVFNQAISNAKLCPS